MENEKELELTIEEIEGLDWDDMLNNGEFADEEDKEQFRIKQEIERGCEKEYDEIERILSVGENNNKINFHGIKYSNKPISFSNLSSFRNSLKRDLEFSRRIFN